MFTNYKPSIKLKLCIPYGVGYVSYNNVIYYGSESPPILLLLHMINFRPKCSILHIINCIDATSTNVGLVNFYLFSSAYCKVHPFYNMQNRIFGTIIHHVQRNFGDDPLPYTIQPLPFLYAHIIFICVNFKNWMIVLNYISVCVYKTRAA